MGTQSPKKSKQNRVSIFNNVEILDIELLSQIVVDDHFQADLGQNIRAAIYVRVAAVSLMQDTSQRNRCLSYAVEKGYTVVETYSDMGKSRSGGKQPNFQQMMRDAEQGSFDVILITDLNRLSRRTRELNECIKQLRSYNVRIAFVGNVPPKPSKTT